MPTLKEVAQAAGVSVATASYVLTGKRRMSDDVMLRVREAAKRLGYQPNRAARALRMGRSHTLGLIVPDITNPFFPQLAQAIEARARAEGYATVLFESGYQSEAEAQALKFLTERDVDGIIWVLSGSGRVPTKRPSIPTVVVDYAPPGWSSVHADDYGGGQLQARFAIEAGHRNVALLWGPLSVTSIQERRRGFLDECVGDLNIVLELESHFTMSLARSVQAKLADRSSEYTLLICGNDVLAAGAMRSLRRAGIEIPDEVSVLGFDDTILCDIVEPSLSTIAQPTRKLGTLSVEMLLRALGDENRPPEVVVVPVRLRERLSTRRIVPDALVSVP